LVAASARLPEAEEAAAGATGSAPGMLAALFTVKLEMVMFVAASAAPGAAVAVFEAGADGAVPAGGRGAPEDEEDEEDEDASSAEGALVFGRGAGGAASPTSEMEWRPRRARRSVGEVESAGGGAPDDEEESDKDSDRSVAERMVGSISSPWLPSARAAKGVGETSGVASVRGSEFDMDVSRIRPWVGREGEDGGGDTSGTDRLVATRRFVWSDS